MVQKHKPFHGIKRSDFPVVTTTGENVDTLLQAGVFDAQGLSSRETARLATKLGLAEIAGASAEAERIEAETGHKPQIFGREILKVVKTARQEGDPLADSVKEQRAQLYEGLADQVKSEIN